jgi:phage shock protein E
MMKKILILILMCISFCFYAQTIVKNVDAAAFKKLVDENRSVLIDLRTTDEINNKGMIKGAKQIDFLDKNSEAAIEKLDKKKTYLIYCAGGGRSGDCAALMQKMDFKEVINLEKGFDDWKRKGFEIEKK